MPTVRCSRKTLILDNSSKNAKFKKSFLIRFLRWTSFLMIPLTFLYDEYIDRPKLSEKKPFEYIVTPPQVGSEQNLYQIRSLNLTMRDHYWADGCFSIKVIA